VTGPSGTAAIDRPVFVIGTGRSGLSPLMDLIAYHPAFGWPSQYNDRWPSHVRASALSRVVQVPPFTSKVKFRRGVPTHAETYRLWNRCFPGFAEPFQDLVADDVTPYADRLFRQTVEGILRAQRKPRLITEYSGWSRIGFLKEIFPDAVFVHIVRDGRAVAHSFINVDWWDGWNGVHRWRIGMPSAEMLEKLERYGYSFLAIAAVYWKTLVLNITNKGKALPENDFLVIRYEDLVADPHKEARRAVEFVGLDPGDRRFERHLGTVKIVDANQHQMRIPPWREAVSARQVEMFEDVAGEELALFGYV
jgi:omega-hydroxy-beta-dihydromenaquinone-9 sulfotransferase